MEVSLEGETDPQDDRWESARREQRHAKQRCWQCGRTGRLKRAMMEGKDGGKDVGRKGPGPGPRPREPGPRRPERERAGWSNSRQRVGGVGPATSQAPAVFGWGGGAWVHVAPALIGSLAEYLIVPGARLYTTLQQLHKAYTLQQSGPQVVTRSWLGVPWLGCSLTDGRPPCLARSNVTVCLQHVPKRLRWDRGFPGT